MAVSNQLNISSFNCTGVKSSIEYVAGSICPKYNIIALQELWIMPHELDVINDVHGEFKSSVDVECGVLRGRPYGGLGFMWHRSLDAHVTPVPLEDDRLMAHRIYNSTHFILLINV